MGCRSHAQARHRHVRARVVIAMMLVLVAAGCTSGSGGSSENGDEPRGEVLQHADLTVRVGEATITVPAGAAPAGTVVTATVGERRSPKEVGGVRGLIQLADPITVRLGDGLQPQEPLRVEIPVRADALAKPNREAVALALRGENGDIDLVRARFEPETGSVVGTVPHLSDIWPISFDLEALIGSVRDGVLQALGLESPRPTCEGRAASVSGRTYTAVSPAQAWICTKQVNGQLRVTAYPNSAIPFLVTSSRATSGAMTRTDVSLSNALVATVARHTGLSGDDQSFSIPGGQAHFDYAVAPDTFRLEFKQYPAMLLLSILGEVLDVAIGGLDVKALEAMGKLECMQAVVEAGTEPGAMLSAERAAAVYRAFFPCVEPLLGRLSPAQRILLAIVSAGPQFLVASVLGILNEFTGQGRFAATIEATAPAPSCWDAVQTSGVDGLAELIIEAVNSHDLDSVAECTAPAGTAGSNPTETLRSAERYLVPISHLTGPCELGYPGGTEAIVCYARGAHGERVWLTFNSGSAGEVFQGIYW